MFQIVHRVCLWIIFQEVSAVLRARSASKSQLQSLLGKLVWTCQAVHGGCPHIRRLMDRVNTLQGPHHRTRITTEMKRNLAWWITVSHTFKGAVPMLDSSAHASISIDLSSFAAGGFFWTILQHSQGSLVGHLGSTYQLQGSTCPGTHPNEFVSLRNYLVTNLVPFSQDCSKAQHST